MNMSRHRWDTIAVLPTNHKPVSVTLWDTNHDKNNFSQLCSSFFSVPLRLYRRLYYSQHSSLWLCFVYLVVLCLFTMCFHNVVHVMKLADIFLIVCILSICIGFLKPQYTLNSHGHFIHRHQRQSQLSVSPGSWNNYKSANYQISHDSVTINKPTWILSSTLPVATCW